MDPLVTRESIADRDQAIEWFDAELDSLLASVTRAAEIGLHAHTWHLAWALADYLEYRGRWQNWLATQQTALDAAEHVSDRRRQAYSHRILGRAHAALGHHRAAHDELGRAVEIYGDLGDDLGLADTHLNINAVFDLQGRHRRALSHAGQALTLYRRSRRPDRQALALNAIGWLYAQVGQHHQAVAHCGNALRIQRELDDHRGTAATWDSLGYALHNLDRHRQAVDCYQHALDLYHEIGDHFLEAMVLVHLGDGYLATGDRDRAQQSWQRAMEIFDQLSRPEAAQVSQLLTRLNRPADSGTPAAQPIRLT